MLIFIIKTEMEITCKKCGCTEYHIIEKTNQHTAYCNNCSSYIKNVPYQPAQFYVGKYKGRTVESMTTKKELLYLEWWLENIAKGSLKEAIIKQLEKFG